MAKIEESTLPVILVTNDDGVTAPGIKNLIEAVKDLGKIVVVAPDKPQSGMGHAITIGTPLRLYPVNIFEGIEAYQCSGTPVDCVKLAVDKVLHRKPDLCISGINHGSNHSINVIYSGTMSAAVEAAIESIPSVGFSLLDYSMEADFSAARKYARIIVENLLENPLDKHLILNVNIPALDDASIKGMKICRQAYAKYEEDFIERFDPNGRKYYWLTGKFVNFDKGDDTDVWALENNYVSVVPVQFDLTNYTLKTKRKNLEVIMLKKDNLKFGVLIGFIAPVFSLVIYYLIKFYPLFSVRDFMNFIGSSKGQVTAISVPCLVLNIALFTFYINSHRDQTAKGIFAITLAYAIAALVFKYIL